ncbi:MAG: endolytic transglycosylase MltG, partial [Pseudomonadales bacterium]
MRSLLSGLIFLAIVAAAILAWFWQDMQRELHSPMPVAATTDYSVERGMTLRTIATDLHQRGWITQPYYLLFTARQQDLGGRIKAGEYVIEPGTSPQDFLAVIVSGRVKQYSLTIVEGWNYRELLAAVRAHPKLEQALATRLERDPDALAETLALSYPHPEGLFYPDTYNFPAGTTDVQFLQRAHRTLLDVLEQEWGGREADLPYESAYEALIMASIIEKETAVAAERGEIAGVFYRRLKTGMRLQTDPTVIYAIGENYDGNLRRA